MLIRLREDLMRHLLPVGKPPLLSLRPYAHPLSILAQGDAYLPWLYSRCIQLYCYPGEDLEMLLQPLSPHHWWRHLDRICCPLLDVQDLDLRVARSLSEDLIHAWATLIASGHYVQIEVGPPLSRARCTFALGDPAHIMLLHGVDEDAGVFIARGGDFRSHYVSREVSFAQVARWATDPLPEAGPRTVRGRSSGAAGGESETGHSARMLLLRYRPESRADLDRLSVLEQLEDYLSGRNSSLRWRLNGAARGGGVWGMTVYGWLRELVAQMRGQRAAFSPRVWQVLWEHKSCMAARLRFLEGAGLLFPVGLAAAYDEVVHLAHRLVQLLKNQNGRDGGGQQDAASQLGRMAVREQQLLNQVGDRLQGVA